MSTLSQEDVELEVDPDPALEREAEDVAQSVSAGSGSRTRPSQRSALYVQRLPADEIDENKLEHVFGQGKHDLDPVVREFGSRERAFRAIRRAIETKVEEGEVNGLYEETVDVGSYRVTVRGKVVDGRARIGTAWRDH